MIEEGWDGRDMIEEGWNGWGMVEKGWSRIREFIIIDCSLLTAWYLKCVCGDAVCPFNTGVHNNYVLIYEGETIYNVEFDGQKKTCVSLTCEVSCDNGYIVCVKLKCARFYAIM